jgi:hypothetical protein
MKQLSMDRYMGILKLNLKSLDLEKAIIKFAELNSCYSQFGMDESIVIVVICCYYYIYYYYHHCNYYNNYIMIIIMHYYYTHYNN